MNWYWFRGETGYKNMPEICPHCKSNKGFKVYKLNGVGRCLECNDYQYPFESSNDSPDGAKLRNFEEFALSVVPVELCLTYTNPAQYISAAFQSLILERDKLKKELQEANNQIKLLETEGVYNMGIRADFLEL